jgi:uncharacterized protein YciI
MRLRSMMLGVTDTETPMLFTIHFQDNPDADPDIRRQYMTQHLAFLSENREVIKAAGPLKEPDGRVTSGLWLVDVETIDQACDLVQADPLWPTGLRDTVEIKYWAQVFADGQPLV